ncbi:MAG: D-alanine--D-alanine ligase [Eubacteriales bacterium]|nr:D-alanine--D-alanine ligase [Eubacteriales bacterium]
MEKLKIVVLCGGCSTERYISFLTGAKVCGALRRCGHRAVLADLYLGFEEAGDCFDPESLFASLPPIAEYRFDGKAPDLDSLRLLRREQHPALFGKHVLELCRAADIVFIALHGQYGEDGRVQSVFDMYGVPYTGSGYLGAAMAMDKMITKTIVGAGGVRTPLFRRWDYEIMEEEREEDARERLIREVCRETALPCVVKTPGGGSSVGVYIVRGEEELRDAVIKCLTYGKTFMTEQYIDGREFTCGILCGQALPSVEIVPLTSFYDYSNKYRAGATEEICPGRVSAEIEQEIGRTALRVHEIMGLSTYSRSDFMIDAENRVWFIEVNTLPGMTDTSLVPREAAAVGISFEELCEKIVEDGLRIRGKK